MAQKFMATSEAYVASTNGLSFAALSWLAMWLNGLMDQLTLLRICWRTSLLLLRVRTGVTSVPDWSCDGP
ncbi:MAG TPA: hypothetical protein DHC76_09825 [Rhodobacteraceae bacterium]|jgi:hypothetical protein|nr:hypothetical protein [Paracoccaceae bacterium]